MTSGIAALPEADQIIIAEKVQTFDVFTVRVLTIMLSDEYQARA